MYYIIHTTWVLIRIDVIDVDSSKTTTWRKKPAMTT